MEEGKTRVNIASCYRVANIVIVTERESYHECNSKF